MFKAKLQFSVVSVISYQLRWLKRRKVALGVGVNQPYSRVTIPSQESSSNSFFLVITTPRLTCNNVKHMCHSQVIAQLALLILFCIYKQLFSSAGKYNSVALLVSHHSSWGASGKSLLHLLVYHYSLVDIHSYYLLRYIFLHLLQHCHSFRVAAYRDRGI